MLTGYDPPGKASRAARRRPWPTALSLSGGAGSGQITPMKTPADAPAPAARRLLRVGVSTCLLGKPVRYDGGHKLDHFLTDTLGRYVESCRSARRSRWAWARRARRMRLVRRDAGIRMVVAQERRRRHRRDARVLARRVERLAGEDLSGYVLKKDSPSCGMERVKVYGETGAGGARRRRRLRRGAAGALPAPAGGGGGAAERRRPARQLRRARLRLPARARPLRGALDDGRAGALPHRPQAAAAGAPAAGLPEPRAAGRRTPRAWRAPSGRAVRDRLHGGPQRRSPRGARTPTCCSTSPATSRSSSTPTASASCSR